MSHGVHRYPRKRRPDLRSEERRERERRQHQEQIYNDLWRTVPKKEARDGGASEERRRALLELPQENILYFLEKTAPRLQPWQREILRIVRHVAQYFYPQRQTKVMNEGCATYCHYRIMTRLHETGRISDGSYLEFLQSHTNVIRQPEFDDRHFGGWNPYALGFAMMQDIERICTHPTDEDREWFPDIAGNGDAMGTLRNVWANYRDESFIAQFLSPHLIRQWRMFHLVDDANDPELKIEAIHNERGFRRVRRTLARQYDVAWTDPDIQVIDVDLAGDRRLFLQHNVVNGLLLDEADTRRVLQHLADLWGYDIILREVEADADTVRQQYAISPRQAFL
jgi:spore cortex formation protein SpoVR/YcgB (stage V sporulation)